MTEGPNFSLRDGLALAGVDLEELWWRYVAIGGSADLAAVSLLLRDGEVPDSHEHDLMAQALNEMFVDSGMRTFPVAYSGVPPVLPETSRRLRQPPLASASRARRDAALARLRSAGAARQAAVLHGTAARLMHASGQLSFASRATSRADAARRRGRPLASGWEV